MTEHAGIDMTKLRSWIGRTDSADDQITPALVRRFDATFGDSADDCLKGGDAPLGIHWCVAPIVAPPSETGSDGHPIRGKFLPPVTLPRRMWAGGEITFHGPLKVGDQVERKSRIADVALKVGRSGRLLFVTIEHRFSNAHEVAISERQDLVFRDAPAEATPVAAPPALSDALRNPAEHQSREHHADPVTLFRYSALTFNGHRIHYDYRYAAGEGYADIVVHGPYQATLLLRLAAQLKGRSPKTLHFRSLRPLLAPQSFRLTASRSSAGLDMNVVDDIGATTMKAKAAW